MNENSNIRFRLATIGDLDAIVRMIAHDDIGATRERIETPTAECYNEAFNDINTDPKQELIVVDEDGQVAGCLELTFIRGLSREGMLRAQIESVRVADHLRGQGVGQQLFEHAISRARERGCGLVQLTSDKARPDAIRFYEQLGFTASHEGMKLKL